MEAVQAGYPDLSAYPDHYYVRLEGDEHGARFAVRRAEGRSTVDVVIVEAADGTRTPHLVPTSDKKAEVEKLLADLPEGSKVVGRVESPPEPLPASGQVETVMGRLGLGDEAELDSDWNLTAFVRGALDAGVEGLSSDRIRAELETITASVTTFDAVRSKLKKALMPDIHAHLGMDADGEALLDSGLAGDELKAARKASHARVVELVRSMKSAGRSGKLVSNDIGNLGERWYKCWVLDAEVAGSDKDLQLGREVKVPRGDGGVPSTDRRVDHVVHEQTGERVLSPEETAKLFDSQFVEVKAGSEQVKTEQLDDYVEMAGKEVRDKDGDIHKVEAVRYVFLDPKGGKANLELLVPNLDAGGSFKIELFNQHGEHRTLSRTYLDRHGLDVDDVSEWLDGNGEMP